MTLDEFLHRAHCLCHRRVAQLTYERETGISVPTHEAEREASELIRQALVSGQINVFTSTPVPLRDCELFPVTQNTNH